MMIGFDQMLERLDEDEADVMRELDRRMAMAQMLVQKRLPDLDLAPKDYADVVLQFFDRVDDFLDSLEDDEE